MEAVNSMVYGVTIPGEKPDPSKPTDNDRVFAPDTEREVTNPLTGVFDGVSTAQNPSLGSEVSKNTLGKDGDRFMEDKHTRCEIENGMRKIVEEIELNIRMILSVGGSAGTTGVIAKLWRDLKNDVFITIGHLGDSRAYRERPRQDNTKVIQSLTLDDTKLNRFVADPRSVNLPLTKSRQLLAFQNLVDRAAITRADLEKILKSKFPDLQDPSKDRELQQVLNTGATLTKCIGHRHSGANGGDDIPNVTTLRVNKGDKYYLVSDGALRMIPKIFRAILARGDLSPGEKAALIHEKNKNRVSPPDYDDISFVSVIPQL